MKTSLLRRVFGAVVFISLFTSAAFAQTSTENIASLQTDKSDYQPGDTVKVTGSYWMPGETVMLIFKHTTISNQTDTLYAAAEATGIINNAQYLISENDIGENFLLTAIGQTSGYSVQATFADTPPVTTIITVDPAEGTYGGKVNLTATLTQTNHNPISNQYISFTLNGKSVGVPVKTGGNGKATYNNASLDNIDAGTYPSGITASFSGTPNYAASSGSGVLTVDQANTNLIVENSSGTYNGTVNLRATLKSANIYLGGMPITFSFNGTEYTGTTNDDGVAIVNNVSLSGINAGTHNGFIKANFAGSTNYEASPGSGNLTVNPASTSLAVEPIEAVLGGSADITAVLTSDSKPVPDMDVSFTLGGVLRGTAKTGADGKAVLTNVSLSGISSGVHENYIGASFSPSGGNYLPSSGTAALTITELPTTLTVNSVTGIFGSSVTLEAVLTVTSSDIPLSNMIINFTFNGSQFSAQTDASGTARISNVSLAGINAGSYPGVIKADFYASGGYLASTGTGDLKVDQALTELTVNGAAGTFGSTLDLSAKLTYNGLPISGKTVSFMLKGLSVGTGTTDESGVALVKGVSLSGIDAGTYPDAIEADFTADGNYASSTGKGELIVNQVSTTLTVENASGPWDGKVTLSARLTSTVILPEGLIINFSLNGSPVGSAATDKDGKAVLSDVSISNIAVGIYANAISASFSPVGGNYAHSIGYSTLEVTLAPTSISVDDVTAVYGTKATLKAKLTYGDNKPVVGKSIEFTINQVSKGSAITDANGLATLSDVDLSGIKVGTYPGYIIASFTEDNPYKGSTGTGDLEVTKAQTAVSVSISPAEVQYSDQVTITAVVTSATAQTDLNTTGGSVEFKYQLADETPVALATVTTSSLDKDGNLAFSYTFTCSFAPNVYKILATFIPSDKDNFDGSTNISPFGPITVIQEDAEAEYSGLQYFSTASPTSFTATLTYSATVKDIVDDFRGDVSNDHAKVSFKEGPLSGTYSEITSTIKPEEYLKVFLIDPADKTVGTAATQPFSRNLTQSEQNSNGTSFNLYTIVNGFYKKLSDPVLITISIPGSDNVSGGGFIVTNNSAGQYKSKPGSKTNFGFTMKYNKSGKNLQGQANIIIRGENDKIYQIKSNAINSMSVYNKQGQPGKFSSFSTKANLTDITDPVNPVSLGGNLSLAVDIYDEGNDNEKDAIGITLQDPNSGLLYSSHWDGTKTLTQTLAHPNGGGNIKVMNNSLSKNPSEQILPKEYALFQNYPNPFNPSTTIQFDLPEDSRVDVVIYDILGKVVTTLVSDNLPAGRQHTLWNSVDQYGSPVASGMYILRVSAKSLSSDRNLVSTKKMMLIK